MKLLKYLVLALLLVAGTQNTFGQTKTRTSVITDSFIENGVVYVEKTTFTRTKSRELVSSRPVPDTIQSLSKEQQESWLKWGRATNPEGSYQVKKSYPFLYEPIFNIDGNPEQAPDHLFFWLIIIIVAGLIGLAFFKKQRVFYLVILISMLVAGFTGLLFGEARETVGLALCFVIGILILVKNNITSKGITNFLLFMFIVIIAMITGMSSGVFATSNLKTLVIFVTSTITLMVLLVIIRKLMINVLTKRTRVSVTA